MKSCGTAATAAFRAKVSGGLSVISSGTEAEGGHEGQKEDACGEKDDNIVNPAAEMFQVFGLRLWAYRVRDHYPQSGTKSPLTAEPWWC